MFAVAAGFDESGIAEEREVMADGGLALLQPLAEGRDVQFAFLHEVEEDLEARLIGEELEDLDQVFLQAMGQFGKPPRDGLLPRGRGDRSNHAVLLVVGWCRRRPILAGVAALREIRILRDSVRQIPCLSRTGAAPGKRTATLVADRDRKLLWKREI